MSNKKSFVLYKDSLQVLNDLSDEQAGKLFKAIKAIQLGEDFELDALTKVALSPFKAQFTRDNEKYEMIVERNKNNGLKGGRPKTELNPEKAKEPSGIVTNPENPKKADSDSDSDSDSEKNKNLSQSEIAEKEAIPVKEIVAAYNEICTNLPEAKTISSKQKRIIWLKARWREQPANDQNLDWWRGYFDWCNKHPQLTGQQEGFNWIASLEDLVNASKFQRLTEKGSL